jgi:hypothetical protein
VIFDQPADGSEIRTCSRPHGVWIRGLMARAVPVADAQDFEAR